MLLYRALILVHALALANARTVIQPSNLSKRAPAQVISILDKMTNSSVNGACTFPSKSVLHDFKTFDFFEECNRQLPTQLTPHTPSEDVLCMGLYEIGYRICNIVTKYQLPLTVIPSEPDFKKFITDPNKKASDTKLCSEFERLPMPQVQGNEGLDVWNTMRIFKQNPQVCPQICFYINGDAKELCRLILWGNIHFVNVTRLAASNEAVQSRSEPKGIAPEVVYKSIEVQTEDYSRGISGTGGEQSSPTQQDAQYLQHKDSSNQKISSQDISQNAAPQTIGAVTDDQKSGTGRYIDGSKHSSLESLSEGGNTHLADQGDHPEPADPPKNQKDLPRARAEKQKPIKSNVENTKQHEEEITAEDLSSKKLDERNQEAKIYKQDVKEKVTSAEVALPPAFAPTAIAPKTPDEIVEDTASNPSNDANLEPNAGEDFSKYGDPSLEPVEDEDIGIDQPIKADESINGDDNRPSDPLQPISPEQPIKYDVSRFEESEDSHFFRYFMTMVVICIFGYLLFHNKQKILALFLEGRSRRGTRRRPNTANYHKLDCNLEEAVSSPCSASVAHVIY